MPSSTNSASRATAQDTSANTTASTEKADFVEKEKTIGSEEKSRPARGEVIPGWTIMRPLKRGEKAGGSESESAVVDREGKIDGKHSKLKATETNGSGDGYDGVGEMDGLTEVRSDDELLGGDEEGRYAAARRDGGERGVEGNGGVQGETVMNGAAEYKVYKRRWFGLTQLVLLNIIVSWDWLSFSAGSTTASQYYNITESDINWLSTSFLFAFTLISPLTIYILHRGGPKPAIIIASVLILAGNWIRYGATRAGPNGSFGGVMFGQILTGLAQPFVLSAPTRYSDLWFTNRGRVAATAVMSLANPFGGALGQLIDPFWAGGPGDIPNMVLYIAIISSVATLPSFFIPAGPPTPSSPSSTTPKQKLLPSLRFLFTSPEFYMIMIPFSVYVGLFNSCSSLINQMLAPYSFSETAAGIAGALLIVVGLVASAVTSPIIDRTKSYLVAIKLQVPIIALCYLAFTWAPGTRSFAAVYAILSLLGAASFSLVPVVLEYLIEITHPVSPEVTSTICWSGGQLLGGIFILISGALRDSDGGDADTDNGTARPPGNMYRALIFQAVLALVVAPLPLALGFCGRGRSVRMRRVEADKEASKRERRQSEGGGVVLR
jgi:MFS family permease